MEWAGATIGWQASRKNYKAHSLSGESTNKDIGCLYSSTYSAVAYKICTYDCECSLKLYDDIILQLTIPIPITRMVIHQKFHSYLVV